MYTEHVYCKEYNEYKQALIDMINGDETEYSIDEIKETIQQLYEEDKIPSTQYDELIMYIDELT